MLTAFRNTVAGAEVTASVNFESFDPFTGKSWALIPAEGPDQVNAAVAAAKAAFKARRSGIGRESGQEAIREYLQTKSLWIDHLGQTATPFVIR